MTSTVRFSDVLHAIPCGCPVIADCALKLNQLQGEKERVAVVVRFMWWRILYVGEALAQALVAGGGLDEHSAEGTSRFFAGF